MVLGSEYALVLREHELLSFFSEIDCSTGEVRDINHKGKKSTPRDVAFYRNFKFTLYETGTVIIQGSLHYYWNDGKHNYNDFSLASVTSSLNEFLKLFSIKPNDAKLMILEVGINIRPPYPSKKILLNMPLHKTQKLERCSTKKEGNYYQAEHQHYIIKIYDKKTQFKEHFPKDDELIRFEIKYKSQRLRKLGIETIQDLMNIPFSMFIDDLVLEMNNILFYDFTIDHPTKESEKYSNPNYWYLLLDDGRKSAYYKHLNKLKSLIENHSENIRGTLIKSIIDKGNFLTNEGISINDQCIGLIPAPPTKSHPIRICPITGLDISMQREDSRLLSHTGLRYYRDFDFKEYERLERVLLGNRWGDENENVRLRELAHQIRNRYYNNRSHINPYQMILF